MRPFQRLLHRRPEAYTTASVETSSSSSTFPKKQRKNEEYSESKKAREHHVGSIASNRSSSRRSRSVDRRLDHHHSTSTRKIRPIETQTRETRWFERLGGSVASVGRPKSVDSSVRRAHHRSQQHRGRPSSRSRSRSRSRSKSRGRSRSKSTGRSAGMARTTQSSRHSPLHNKSDKSVLKRGPIEATSRLKGKEPASLRERVDSSGRWFQSSRANPSVSGDEQAFQSPPTGPAKWINSTDQAAQPSIFPITNQTRSTPPTRSLMKSSVPPVSLPPKAPSAFQRWPRLSTFRQKTIDQTTNDFTLDPAKSQQLLTMVLGNNGSMFEEGSTLNAPKGVVMRTEPQRRIDGKAKIPAKECGDHVVEAALMFEAISASPFICIQTVCCVQDDYLVDERNKLKSRATADQSRTTSSGPPVVIKVDGVAKAPKVVEIARDEPSVSVFTGGTVSSKDGFWLPFGLGFCGESLLEERDERSSTPELSSTSSHGRQKKPTSLKPKDASSDDSQELGTSLQDFRPSSRSPVDVDDDYNQPSSSPVSQSDEISRSSQSEKGVHCKQRDDVSVTRYSPASSTHSDENVSIDKSKIDHEERNDGAQSVSPSWDDNGAPINPERKLDEWEEMEAKLKAILMQKDTVTDVATIYSM